MTTAETTKMKITKSQLRKIINEELSAELIEADRTAKGSVTQAAREKYATVGDDKFPIFDKKSAESAIDLRGHAPKADRAKIINKAAKYAPEAAKKAREEDKEKNESRKISKSQLLDLIREEAAKEMDRHSKGENYEVKIGKDAGRGKIQSTIITVKATSRDDAKRKALQDPTFKNGKYEYAMLAAPGSLEDYT